MPTYEALPRSSRSSERERMRSESPLPYTSRRYEPNTRTLLQTLIYLPRRLLRTIYHRRRLLSLFPITILALLLLAFLNPIYHPSRAPPYNLAPSTQANETVFIAANILSRELVLGPWGDSLVELVDLIGKDRVFVSIYGGPSDALAVLDMRLGAVGVKRWIVTEGGKRDEKIEVEKVRLPDGERRVKRIAFLAAIRNRVLEPLYNASLTSRPPPSLSSLSGELNPQQKPTKILFLNDVHFNAEGAMRLLFGTRVGKEGVTTYKAACAADFVSAWKMYDTFATRDSEGYSLGVPVFPWFSVGSGGEGGVSRRDVLQGRDSVRVKSCWGGMVSFRGEYFWGQARIEEDKLNSDPTAQNTVSTSNNSSIGKKSAELTTSQSGLGVPTLPLHFRSEPEPFWDSSECCLIHADIMALPDLPPSLSPSSYIASQKDPQDTGIYLNPYVRTSYSATTHQYIWLAQRFERLLSPIQRILNWAAGMPVWNARRAEKEGEKVKDKVWFARKGGTKGNGNGEGDGKGETIEDVVRWAEAGFVGDLGNLTGVNDAHSGGVVRRKEIEEDMEVQRTRGKRETLGQVKGKEYWANEGYYVDYERTARRGGYCGVRQLLVMKEGEIAEGEGNWDNLLDRVPSVDV